MSFFVDLYLGLPLFGFLGLDFDFDFLGLSCVFVAVLGDFAGDSDGDLDLGVDLGVDLGDLGVDLGDLFVDLGDLFVDFGVDSCVDLPFWE